MDITNASGAAALTFEEFAKVYRATFAKMLGYKLTEVGSDVYCDKLADLADAYPAWAELVEEAR